MASGNQRGNQAEKKRRIVDTVLLVGNTIYVVIAIGIAALIGCLPLVLCFFFAHNVSCWPIWALAAWLSCPGLAAAFALFRDSPVLQPHGDLGRYDEEVVGNLPDWVARPYVPVGKEAAVWKPYFRAWAHLAGRSLLVGLAPIVVIALFVLDILLLRGVNGGFVAVPFLIVLCVLLADTVLVALILVTEYPKAHYGSLMRNGFLLSVRRIWMLLFSVLIAVGYGLGVEAKAIIVLPLATGFVLYCLWASARWQAKTLVDRMAAESDSAAVKRFYRLV
jgi:hypothetical protein